MMMSALTAASAPSVNLLLLAEPGSTELAQRLVQHALVQEFLAAPEIHLITPEPVPAALLRAGSLRQTGLHQLSLARARMHALNPTEAATLAAMATEKLGRLATLSGDVTPLVDSLALQAAAYLHAGAQAAARRTLTRLLVLRPSWQPDCSLYNPDMQRTVRTVRKAAAALPTRTVAVVTEEKDTAVFADGHFVGYGTVEVNLTACQPHYLWASPKNAEALGTQVVPQLAASSTATLLSSARGASAADADPETYVEAYGPPLSVRLTPMKAAPPSLTAARYQSVFAAAAAADGIVEPTLPALAGAHLDTIWVVSGQSEALKITAFDLQRGHRSTAPARLTEPDLSRAHTLVHALTEPMTKKAAAPARNRDPYIVLQTTLPPQR